MFTVFLGFKQIWNIILKVGQRHDTKAILVSVFSLLLLGTLFFSIYEGFPIIDSLYFCVVTLMTIGYGDLTPVTTLGKLFTIVYAFLGVGIVGLLVGIFAREFLIRKNSNFENNHFENE
ncbi:MAG: potassium channel family protein [Bacilli bacterium]